MFEHLSASAPAPRRRTPIHSAPTFDAPALPGLDALGVPQMETTARPSADAVARAAVSGLTSGPATPASGPDVVFTAATVDEPVVPLVQPAPRYPPVMAAARVSGFVLVEFVVDTLGKAAPASTRVLEASHEVLAEAATETILRSTFRPARSAGRPVRQLVRQRVTFSAP